MSGTQTDYLNWYVPQNVWDLFEGYIAKNHVKTGIYYRFELEQAMKKYADIGGSNYNPRQLLRKHTDLLDDSSTDVSIEPLFDLNDSETTKVRRPVRSDIKETFQRWVDENSDYSYGKALSRAIIEYLTTLESQILNDIILNQKSSSMSKDIAVESIVENTTLSEAEVYSRLTNLSIDERSGHRSMSTEMLTKIRNKLYSKLKIDEIDEVTGMIASDVIKSTIQSATGYRDCDNYIEQVCDMLNLVPHPDPKYKNQYVTESRAKEIRNELTLWDDLNRDEKIVLLRRWSVREVLKQDQTQGAFTYANSDPRDSYPSVRELFIEETGHEPSHQFLYDIMRDAAEADGFEFGTFHDEKKLRVNVDAVNPGIIEWVSSNTPVEVKTWVEKAVQSIVDSSVSIDAFLSNETLVDNKIVKSKYPDLLDDSGELTEGAIDRVTIHDRKLVYQRLSDRVDHDDLSVGANRSDIYHSSTTVITD